jgi:DNA-binding winged helix-turn-helix (wHTH) protein
MEALATAGVFLFERFRLDRNGLFRRDPNGAFVPIAIGSRALEVLYTLVKRSGDLVSRDEISEAVWPGTVVEGSNLPVQIAALRRVLDKGRADSSCIQTIPGRGYHFIAPVTRASAETRLPLPDKPSIAVLPFANLSGDPEQDYFADGMVEEIITALSRIRWLFVIAPQFELYLQGPDGRRETGRPRARRPLCPGRLGAQGQRSGTDYCATDRRDDGRPSVGRSL